MKNKIILVLAFISFGLFFTSTVFADTSINLQIKNNSHIIYDGDINVRPCDSDKNIDTPDIETPYCAIMQSGISNVWDWTWNPGAFVTSIDNVAGSTTKDENGNNVYHYWSWFLNGSEAQEGLNQYQLKNDDKILLDFINPIEEKKVEPEVHHSSGSYILPIVATSIIPKIFNIENALKFLEMNQKIDGSFGNILYTDWVAVAVAAGDDKIIKEKIIKYLKENDIETSLPTDNERHAMALMSLGIDPYTGTKVNYIKNIIDSFDGTQFGDKNLYNDDIFALIVLKNAGYNENDELVQKDINYLITKQNKDGSWGSIDMTAAYIEAMKGLENILGVKESISKSESYIILNQKADGSFENTSSTSWVLQSFYDNEKILKAEKYLADKQEIDGGLEKVDTNIDTRIWVTSYALPAILHKSWGEILKKFPKQEITIIPAIREELVNKDQGIKKTGLSKKTDKETNAKDLEIIQQDIVKKVIFSSKLKTFWVNTKHSFRWLLNKLSF